MLLPPLLETPRLQLRRPRPEDAPWVASAIAESIDQLATWFRWAEVLQRYGDLEDMGARAVSSSRRFDELSNPIYAVWHRHRFVGEVMIDNPHWEDHRALELEVWIRPSAQGHGFATEALQVVVDHLLHVQGSAILEARVNPANAGSRKLFQRLGFQSHGHLRDHNRFVLHAEESSEARHLGVVVSTHPACLDHQVGPDHSERPERLDAVLEGLKGLPITLLGAPRGLSSLALAHPPEHLDALEELAPEQGVAALDADTDLSAQTVDAALRGVGGVVSVIDLVLAGRASSGFVATRPPGHHALPAQAKGFCFFATAAIGVLHARRNGRCRRVALVDFDVHHGDGSEEVLRGEPGVLFVSLYEALLYPQPELDPGEPGGNVVRVPLEPHTDSRAYRRAVREHVLTALHDFGPALIVVSAGFDGHSRDTHSTMTLDAEDYRWLTAELRALAPIVSVLEGGYDPVALALSARSHVEALVAGSPGAWSPPTG